jgi:queuine tRNA-ribosyltransferase
MLGATALEFTLTHTDTASAARCGLLSLPHGTVETPVFMPVGTQGTVKATTPRDIAETGGTMILANTYHLALRPGADVVRDAGGLHRFMGWSGPILTDSGGFQVFSLARLNKVTADGVSFRSHIDGELIHLTPERSIEVQNALGADVIMVFDECAPHTAGRKAVQDSVERTARWAERSLAAHGRDDQALFGIVQGGLHDDLRRLSASQITALDFPGYAIGGVSVGETPEEMRRVIGTVAPLLPRDRPRYVMGVGTPSDIVDMVGIGVDLFDCVLPTRHARNASLFTRAGLLQMRNQAYAREFVPVEADCGCYTCRNFTRAYLRHLYTRDEMLAGILGSLHNLTFFHRLLEALRRAIRHGRYHDFREAFVGGASFEILSRF